MCHLKDLVKSFATIHHIVPYGAYIVQTTRTRKTSNFRFINNDKQAIDSSAIAIEVSRQFALPVNITMAINKRKQSHPDGGAASGGRGRGGGRPRAGAVRHCTLNVRLEQLESAAIVDRIRHENIEEKLHSSVDEADLLRKEVQQLKDDLMREKALVRVLRHKLNLARSQFMFEQQLEQQQRDHDERVRLLQEELKACKNDAKEAWDHVIGNEREKRRVDAMWNKKLKDAERKASEQGLLAEQLHTRLMDLKGEHQSLTRSIIATAVAARGRAAQSCNPESTKARSVERQNLRLTEDLSSYLQDQLACKGGIHGDTAKAVMVSFFAKHTDLLEHILTELQVYETAERKTVEAIEEQWTVDTCTSIFIHGGLTFAGYQALINIMSKAYNFSDDSFYPIKLPHGTEMPKLNSKNKLHNHLTTLADMFGMKPLDEGKGVAVNINKLVEARLQLIQRMSTEQHPPQLMSRYN